MIRVLRNRFLLSTFLGVWLGWDFASVAEAPEEPTSWIRITASPDVTLEPEWIGSDTLWLPFPADSVIVHDLDDPHVVNEQRKADARRELRRSVL